MVVLVTPTHLMVVWNAGPRRAGPKAKTPNPFGPKQGCPPTGGSLQKESCLPLTPCQVPCLWEGTRVFRRSMEKIKG